MLTGYLLDEERMSMNKNDKGINYIERIRRAQSVK